MAWAVGSVVCSLDVDDALHRRCVDAAVVRVVASLAESDVRRAGTRASLGRHRDGARVVGGGRHAAIERVSGTVAGEERSAPDDGRAGADDDALLMGIAPAEVHRIRARHAGGRGEGAGPTGCSTGAGAGAICC